MTTTYVYDFNNPPEMAPDQVRRLLGGKGANLAVMAAELGLPVPPGFTISTDACRFYLSDGWPTGLDDEIRAHLVGIEESVGKRFGGLEDPLLVSVRSGAAVSMPGMMDTILNLGLNEGTTAALAAATSDDSFAAECYNRLETMYRSVVGSDEVPADPWEQLRAAIEAVFRSWNSDRARAYREREGISEDLGTGVNVQTMVFGNRDEESASGVVFTRNPATGEPGLYGDIMFDAQGEDVVAGTHTPESISVLEERMPQVATELRAHSDVLEHHYRDVCDIEFTIERGKLWMLQVRIGKRTPRAALRAARDMAEEEGFPLTRAEAVERVRGHLIDPPTTAEGRTDSVPLAATGLAASPGLASGSIATTPEEAVEMADAGRRVILVRSETSPDDVHGMARAAGILTAKGGLTSHAAVVARGWGIPAVVGAAAVRVIEGEVTIGEHEMKHGDPLTINGSTGEVFAGAVAVEPAPTPEAAALLSWAAELGISIKDEEGSAAVTKDAEAHDDAGPTGDTVVRALLIKGFATPDLLAPAVLANEESLASALAEMAGDGLIAETAGMFQLTDDGKARGVELIDADRAEWGVDAAGDALENFIPLDHRVKETVTAWQMRDVDGEPTLNDHTDEAYDAAVLADFAALSAEAAAWLAPLTQELSRLQDYASRLEAAAAAVAAGEHTFIASPRVDSYHSIWFELHEDLILLAGRTREDEVAAGRA